MARLKLSTSTPGRTPQLRLLVGSLLTVASLVACRPAVAEDLSALHTALQEQLFSEHAHPVATPWTWNVADAVWELTSGEIRAQKPTAEGQTPGFAFRGKGHVTLPVPDSRERRQLARWIDEPSSETFQVPFTELVYWGSDGLPGELSDSRETDQWKPHSFALNRLEHALLLRRTDPSRRTASALLNDGLYVRAELKTHEWGWLTFEYDDERAEEITLDRFHPGYSVVERWLSIDRPADRASDGRPGSPSLPAADLLTVTARVDLRDASGRRPAQGLSRATPLAAQIEADVEVRIGPHPRRALNFVLHPEAEVSAVQLEGQPVAWVRDPIGTRSRSVRNTVHEAFLAVDLGDLHAPNTTVELRVQYELVVDGYGPGNSWYPTVSSPEIGLTDRHIGTVELVGDRESGLWAPGELITVEEEPELQRKRWKVVAPAKMLTFVHAKNPHEERLSGPEGRQVRSFGSTHGFMTAQRIREVGLGIQEARTFFRELLGVPLPQTTLDATLIPASHGQAFDGFLHLSEVTVSVDNPAAVELFRAHEVAHQWWGNLVGWQGYRHQWLSEGLAEFSALLFVEHTRGEEKYREAIDAFADEITGSIRSSMSPFARPGLTQLHRRALSRVGPIGHGWRARTGEAPAAYQTLAYKKGALALHALRTLSRDLTGSSERFHGILRTFASQFARREATTEDLIAIVNERLPGDWNGFFDQWIYRADVPRVSWSHEVVKSPDGWRLRVELAQTQKAEPFDLRVPLEVRFADNPPRLEVLRQAETEGTHWFDLAERPQAIRLDPDRTLPAPVRKQ